jgi:ppGpp synthetase/RelA/SpoT-type nucleotidyltranferase
LEAADIRVQRVEYRIKSQGSAAAKLARKITADGNPQPLETLTDLLGLRVITYFQDEADAVATLMTREFLIHQENSASKSTPPAPDKSGHTPMYYVASLSADRAALAEYREYAGIRFEVQIRSVLQQAWAEIEHDLGYRAATVPQAARRRFSKLAGMLELADDELVGIRKEVSLHQAVSREAIDQGVLSIAIDQDSLSAFVQSSQQIWKLDRAIAKSINGTVQNRADKEFMSRLAPPLAELGFASIEELGSYLDKEWEMLKKFIHDRLAHIERAPRSKQPPVPMGITLYYAGLLKHAQEVQAGNNGCSAYSGISTDSLMRSLESAKGGGEPLPGVLRKQGAR